RGRARWTVRGRPPPARPRWHRGWPSSPSGDGVRVAARSAPGWLGLLIVAAACNRTPPPGGKPPPDAGAPPARSSGLLRPLPPGWSVATGRDGAVRNTSAPGPAVLPGRVP